ncbi:MAG: CoA transferase [Actinomycetia bacterium]|nr:CoA transferase [Actinomycetes bacterium]
MPDSAPLPLEGLRVIDMATVIAGPGCARYLADFGADVLKVERPGGDTSRNMGWHDPDDDVTFWWKLAGRNKRSVVMDLRDEADRDVFLRLIEDAHVLVENLRPGKLEALGLAPEILHERNPELVVTRVTGFGQDGPYAQKAGFASLAEAMSGFAAINGSADSGPTLPPVALTDEATALAGAFATMVALHSGVGQVVDVNLLESMFQMMGPLLSVYAKTGQQQERMGSQIGYSVPRNTYLCSDGVWVAVSTTADSVARRVLDLVGLGDVPELQEFSGRIANRTRVDDAVAAWIAERPSPEVLSEFERVEAAIAPVFDMADIVGNEHYRARGTIIEPDGIPMQGLIARLSKTPGSVRWIGPPLGSSEPEWL